MKLSNTIEPSHSFALWLWMAETEYPNNRSNLASLCTDRSIIAVQRTRRHELPSTCLSSAAGDTDLMFRFRGKKKKIGYHKQHAVGKLQDTIMDLSHSSAQILGAGWLKFLQWHKLFVASRYASFWCPKIL